MPKPLGFRVEHTPEYGGPADLWLVRAPQQGPWGGIAADGYGCGIPHAEAVAELTRFIAEAQAALVALTERREVSA